MTGRMFAFPTVLGIEYRILNGRVYISSHAVTDPEKIQERLAEFHAARRALLPELGRSCSTSGRRGSKNSSRIARRSRCPALGELEKLQTVMAAHGIAENHYVREAWHRTIESYSKMWNYHFEFLSLGYGAYLVFFQFCKQAFPEIADQTVARMVAGIDVLMFRPDDELKALARRRWRSASTGNSSKAPIIKTSWRPWGRWETRERKWLDAFEAAREPWFNISSGDGFYHHQRSWNDDLTIPFSALPRYIAMVKRGESLDPADREAQEGTRALRGGLSRTCWRRTTTGPRSTRCSGLCHTVFPYVEDHKFFCEHWFVVTFYNKVREFGALLERQACSTKRKTSSTSSTPRWSRR